MRSSCPARSSHARVQRLLAMLLFVACRADVDGNSPFESKELDNHGSEGPLQSEPSGAGGESGAPAAAEVPGPTGPCSATLDSIRATVLGPACAGAGCHNALAPAASLDLASEGVAERLLGRSSSLCDGETLVVPGNPDKSLLYRVLLEDGAACAVSRMPLGGVLADDQVQCISDWISGLAEDGCETCGGADCVVLASDASHCGACDNACAEGSTCERGECVCPPGTAACDGVCTDVLVDHENCGACGSPCPSGAMCAGGSCACPGALAACDAVCVDLEADAENCGDCGNACASGEVCLGGTCSTGCGTLTQCGSSCVDLLSNPLNCGGCELACEAPLECSDGSCGCPGEQAQCGATCADLQTDAANCGACGNACGAGNRCVGGECQCGAQVVSFKDDVIPILVSACTGTGCHSGARPKDDLSLEAGLAYQQLVGVAAAQCDDSRKRVVPGDSANSYLMQKMLGIDMCSGSLMPKAGQGLPAAELALISSWICQGAANN